MNAVYPTSATSAPPSSQYGIGVHADSGIASIAARIALSMGAVTLNRTSALRHAHNILRL